MNNIWILAQAQGQPNQPAGGITAQPETAESTATTTSTVADSNAAGRQAVTPKNQLMQFLPIIVIVVIMYLLMFRGPRKKQQEHSQMVKSLQKNDKVRTIGGIIGTVVDVKDDEITLKIDESSNTKIKVIPSAISKNISQEKK